MRDSEHGAQRLDFTDRDAVVDVVRVRIVYAGLDPYHYIDAAQKLHCRRVLHLDSLALDELERISVRLADGVCGANRVGLGPPVRVVDVDRDGLSFRFDDNHSVVDGEWLRRELVDAVDGRISVALALGPFVPHCRRHHQHVYVNNTQHLCDDHVVGITVARSVEHCSEDADAFCELDEQRARKSVHCRVWNLNDVEHCNVLHNRDDDGERNSIHVLDSVCISHDPRDSVCALVTERLAHVVLVGDGHDVDERDLGLDGVRDLCRHIQRGVIPFVVHVLFLERVGHAVAARFLDSGSHADVGRLRDVDALALRDRVDVCDVPNIALLALHDERVCAALAVGHCISERSGLRDGDLKLDVDGFGLCAAITLSALNAQFVLAPIVINCGIDYVDHDRLRYIDSQLDRVDVRDGCKVALVALDAERIVASDVVRNDHVDVCLDGLRNSDVELVRDGELDGVNVGDSYHVTLLASNAQRVCTFVAVHLYDDYVCLDANVELVSDGQLDRANLSIRADDALLTPHNQRVCPSVAVYPTDNDCIRDCVRDCIRNGNALVPRHAQLSRHGVATSQQHTRQHAISAHDSDGCFEGLCRCNDVRQRLGPRVGLKLRLHLLARDGPPHGQPACLCVAPRVALAAPLNKRVTDGVGDSDSDRLVLRISVAPSLAVNPAVPQRLAVRSRERDDSLDAECRRCGLSGTARDKRSDAHGLGPCDAHGDGHGECDGQRIEQRVEYDAAQ